MSKQIVFIEREEDVENALSFLREAENYQTIALSASVTWELEKWQQPYKIPYDYYSLETLRRLNENLYKRSEDICNYLDKFLTQNIEYFRKNQFAPAHALMHPIKAALNTLCHRLINIKRVLEKEDSSEVILFHNKKAIGKTYRFFSSFTKIHLQLLQLITKQREIALQIIPHERYSKITQSSIKQTVYSLFRRSIDLKLIRRIILPPWSVFDKKKNRVMLKAPHLLTLMILKNSYSIKNLRQYAQENQLVKVIDLSKNSSANATEYISGLNEEIITLWENLCGDKRFINFFSFEDLGLFDDFKELFFDILQKGLTDVIVTYQRTREVLEKEKITALLLPTISNPDEWGCAQACRERNIPVIVWQHGSYAMFDPHTQPIYCDIKHADYFLCFGEGVRQAYAREAKKYGTKLVSIGSIALDQIGLDQEGNRSVKLKNPSTIKKVLMPLRGIDVSYLGDSYQIYPPDIYWKEIKKIVLMFSTFSQIEFILKLYPHNSLYDNPLYNFIKTNKIRNITLKRWPNFVFFLKTSDLVIIDWPYTTLLESVKTSLPVICYKKMWPLRQGVEDLIRKRCLIAEDVDTLQRFLEEGVKAKIPVLDNDELLCRYGNAANDGKSRERALNFLQQISCQKTVKIKRHPN